MSSWHGEQELLHSHLSYKLLELMCLARPKDVAVVCFISFKGYRRRVWHVSAFEPSRCLHRVYLFRIILEISGEHFFKHY